jgi:DNA-binding XRE family transcriptional regulator
MTQIQAAKKLGVSNQTLGRWEKDPKQVTLEMILKMCELYRIDLESLFLK